MNKKIYTNINSVSVRNITLSINGNKTVLPAKSRTDIDMAIYALHYKYPVIVKVENAKIEILKVLTTYDEIMQSQKEDKDI